jgi:hypothetical protein
VYSSFFSDPSLVIVVFLVTNPSSFFSDLAPYIVAFLVTR